MNIFKRRKRVYVPLLDAWDSIQVKDKVRVKSAQTMVGGLTLINADETRLFVVTERLISGNGFYAVVISYKGNVAIIHKNHLTPDSRWVRDRDFSFPAGINFIMEVERLSDN